MSVQAIIEREGIVFVHCDEIFNKLEVMDQAIIVANLVCGCQVIGRVVLASRVNGGGRCDFFYAEQTEDVVFERGQNYTSRLLPDLRFIAG